MGRLPPFEPAPVVLANEHVRVEPLSRAHAEDLLAAGRDEDISELTFRAPFDRVETVHAWIDDALALADAGEQIPFAIVAVADGVAVGSTRLLDIRRGHRALEIGYTWIGQRWQRTVVNTACKLLLLEYAFDTLGANRVQLKTDLLNERSQRAIERIGGRKEGILRKHMMLPDGRVRDTVYYSIVRDEWPEVRTRLRNR